MTDHEQYAQGLDDYVDGSLSSDELREMERHVQSCARCLAEAQRLKALLDEAAALPRSIEPPRELWNGIADGVAERPAAHWPWRRRALLAAAAVAWIAGSSWVTIVVVRQASTGSAPIVADRATRFDEVASYLRATEELEEIMSIARERLAPETLVLIERNLGVIDAAIAEARAALSGDPASAEIRQMLGSRYRSKLDLLRHVRRLSSES